MISRISTLLLIFGFLIATPGQAQQHDIPGSYSNLSYDDNGKLYFQKDGKRYYKDNSGPAYSLDQLLGKAEGTKDGIKMDFGDFEGEITYGLIPYDQAPHPLPVFRFTRSLEDGKIEINIAEDFAYPYDFVGWSDKGRFTLGYRLADQEGEIVFDGEISVTGTGPFEIAPTLYEGPFVSNVTAESAVIWFETTEPVEAKIEVEDRTFTSDGEQTHHEIEITGLEPDRKYKYRLTYGEFEQSYHFETTHEKGSRKPFVFAYTSDSRHATGGGERKIYGANAYIMKKMAAFAYDKDAAFVQFTGDMINGYLTNKEDQHVQYTNWKKSIEPFWHYMPFYMGMGNHEMLGHVFRDDEGNSGAFIDGFPYETHSGEAAFQEAFVNPVNGPESEDGSRYDPNPDEVDFPSYDENVFYYTYGNVAMVVLNSDYWFAPTISREPSTSGGLHGYIMDNQLEWLRETIQQLEKDSDIDHVFVTQHTPVFPNGGHSGDDMWYSGNNEKRPYVDGQPVDRGIIERRDEYLDILINESTKVVGVLTGDEHNYNWLKLTDEVPIYPDDYAHEKLNVSRPIYQINNGASGAPYYGQEILPWSDYTRSFSVENAVCLFYVDGDEITMKVYNPDMLNKIDEVKLR
ncbi:MAG: metallophosphoesterase [Balneolaceae bacterium]|nr:metallophosphoesterase [Balneolaceae bacterium]